MLNSISLVGKIVKMYIMLKIWLLLTLRLKRPFPEEIGKEKFDVFLLLCGRD